MSNSDDFWLVSVPGDKTPQEAWEKLYKSVQNIATAFKFNIPNLKVNKFYFNSMFFFQLKNASLGGHSRSAVRIV